VSLITWVGARETASAPRMPHCDGIHRGVFIAGVYLSSATSLLAARLSNVATIVCERSAEVVRTVASAAPRAVRVRALL